MQYLHYIESCVQQKPIIPFKDDNNSKHAFLLQASLLHLYPSKFPYLHIKQSVVHDIPLLITFLQVFPCQTIFMYIHNICTVQVTLTRI